MLQFSSAVRTWMFVFWAVMLLVASVPSVEGQTYQWNGVGGRQMKFEGQVRHVEAGTTAWVRNRYGEKVVGKLMVEVGEKSVVMLPTGELQMQPSHELRRSGLSFVGLTKSQLGEHLRKEKELEDFQLRQSSRHLYLYNCSEEFLSKAAAILENIHHGVYQFFGQRGFEVHRPECPLVVVIFDRQEALMEYSGIPAEIMAFYDPISNYVFLFEHAREGHLAPHRMKRTILTTVAHEGVHQTLHNIGVQSRLARWPMWLAEGLPEYFSPTTIGASIRWKGAGGTNDLRYSQLHNYIADNNPTEYDLFAKTLVAPKLNSNGYASAWAMTHYLAQRYPQTFWKYVKQVSERVPLGDNRLSPDSSDFAEDAEEFASFFGNDYRKHEGNMISHLARLDFNDPAAKDKAFLYTVEYVKNRRLAREAAISLTTDHIKKWQEQVLKEMGPIERSTAKFRVYEFPRKLDAEKYARRWLKRNGIEIRY